MLRSFRPIAERLVGNAKTLFDAVRVARKDQKVLCGGVMVGAGAHNTA
jgi:hypothetical protein